MISEQERQLGGIGWPWRGVKENLPRQESCPLLVVMKWDEPEMFEGVEGVEGVEEGGVDDGGGGKRQGGARREWPTPCIAFRSSKRSLICFPF